MIGLYILGIFLWSFIGIIIYVERECNNKGWCITNKYKDFLFKILHGPALWMWIVLDAIFTFCEWSYLTLKESKIGGKLYAIKERIRNWFEK